MQLIGYLNNVCMRMYRDNYGFGSIVRIRLINFQKYSDCIIRPGPFMNMLIGPNGTGKSTVVAAIALGLGASPQTVGRSKNPVEFIKYYCSMATIEIIIKCLRPGETASGLPYIVFRRDIRRVSEGERQSDWFINGNESNARQVLVKAQELGVQVDNLCQFLPQDRVSEFAQMTPEKMLEETMEAAATPETCKQFQELVKIKKEEKKMTESLKKDQTELENDQRIMANLQSIRFRAQEREERRKKLEIMKRKRPWLVYQQARKIFIDLKAVRDRLKVELEAAAIVADQELNSQIKEVEANLKISTRKLKQLALGVNNSRGEIHQIHAEASRIAAIISARKTEIREKRNFLQRTRERYEKDRKELHETEEAIARFGGEIGSNSAASTLEAIDSELTDLNAELGEIEAKITEFNSTKDEISSRSAKLRDQENKTRLKIDEIRNLRNRRLESLARLNRNTFAAHEWLNSNRNRFRGNIVGPIALDLKVKDDKMAQAVESVISRSILVSFLCDNVADYDEFARVCEEKGWTTVNSVLLENYSGERTPMPQSPWNRKELKALGFDCIVSELLEAPHMILWALHELSRIHLIPVCLSDRGSASIDVAACENYRGLMKFLSKDSFFEIKRSRYNEADVAIKSSQLKPGFILTQDAGLSSANIEELQERMDDVRSRLNREQEAMKTILERLGTAELAQVRLKQKIESSQERKNGALVTKAELKKKEIHRERLRKSVKDTLKILQNESDESGLLKDLIEKIHERADLLRRLEGLMEAFQESVRIAGIHEMTHRLDTLRLKQFELLRDQRQGQHANLRKQVELAEIDLQRAKTRAQEALAVAEMDQIDAEMKETFAALTDSLEVLDDQIVTEETLLNAGGSDERFGQQDLDQLEKRESSIRTLEEKIRSSLSEIEKYHGKMNEIGAIWRESVDQMIALINEKFEAFFRKISCQGQVRLGVPPNETDYEQYSLAIYVKFRANEEMQRLTGQRQSGGEKSVSTILYLLSLQELSRAPFRVVDEINQGMDVENERKVHALMVETATKMESKRAQYFLITPKLLTGLEYNDKMHILCIFNGKNGSN